MGGLVARWAHNPKVGGSNLSRSTKKPFGGAFSSVPFLLFSTQVAGIVQVFMVVCLALPSTGAHALGRGALASSRRRSSAMALCSPTARYIRPRPGARPTASAGDSTSTVSWAGIFLAAVGRLRSCAHHGAAADGQLGQAPLDGGHGDLVAEQPMPWQVGRDHRLYAAGQAHPLAQGAVSAHSVAGPASCSAKSAVRFWRAASWRSGV